MKLWLVAIFCILLFVAANADDASDKLRARLKKEREEEAAAARRKTGTDSKTPTQEKAKEEERARAKQVEDEANRKKMEEAKRVEDAKKEEEKRKERLLKAQNINSKEYQRKMAKRQRQLERARQRNKNLARERTRKLKKRKEDQSKRRQIDTKLSAEARDAAKPAVIKAAFQKLRYMYKRVNSTTQAGDTLPTTHNGFAWDRPARNLPRLDTNQFKEYIASGPRPYGVLVIFTALNPQHNCQFCRLVHDIAMPVAQSAFQDADLHLTKRNFSSSTPSTSPSPLVYDGEGLPVFVVEVDVETAQPIYAALQMRGAPSVVFVSPQAHSLSAPLHMFLTALPNQNHMMLHGDTKSSDLFTFINKLTNKNLAPPRPPLPVIYLYIALPALVFVVIFVLKQQWFLKFGKLWAGLFFVAGLCLYGFCTGGGWYSILNNLDFNFVFPRTIKDWKKFKILDHIQRGAHGQNGNEGVFFGSICVLMALLLVALVRRAKSRWTISHPVEEPVQEPEPWVVFFLRLPYRFFVYILHTAVHIVYGPILWWPTHNPTRANFPCYSLWLFLERVFSVLLSTITSPVGIATLLGYSWWTLLRVYTFKNPGYKNGMVYKDFDSWS